MTNERISQIAKIFLRLSLSAGFLSAIADRFGLYGPHGASGVSWGDWTHFLQFVAYLNWFMPKALIPTIGAVETIIEFTLAVALLVGVYQRTVAWASAALLTSFALTMTIALGIKAPLGYGVFTAVGGAILLGAVALPQTAPGSTRVSSMDGSSPMEGNSELPFWIEGHPKPSSDNDMSFSLFYLVDPDYLKAMQIPLLRGRFINAEDTLQSPPAVVIDEYFAHKFFPGEDPIGKRVNLEILGVQAEIVGVIGHVKQWGLDENSKSTVEAQFCFSLMQVPDKFMPLLAKSGQVIMRTKGSPDALVGPIRHTIEQINSQEVMYGAESMDSIISNSLAARRFSMILLGIFAAIALLLSCVGIYGVISYLDGQRTHEIGVRMALVGVGIGIAAGLALTRLMGKMLFGVSAHDPLTFGGIAVLLILVALAACYIPARRAMRTDPMVAVRYE